MAKHVKLGSTIHAAFDKLQAIDLTLHLTATPGKGQTGLNGNIILPQLVYEATEFRDATVGSGALPIRQLVRLSLSGQQQELLD